eukprot:scaffold11894_cov53-Attheya_sp.AAC.5
MGCSSHYVMANAPVINSSPANPGIQVQLPDGSLIESTQKANLNITGLPAAASECHIFPSLASGSLLSIGQLCDHDCAVHFNKHNVTIHRGTDLILKGDRQPLNGLWDIPTVPHHVANNVTSSVTSTIANRIAFYHVTIFSPAISTWCRAIDAGHHFTTWLELTSKQVRQHLPASRAMLKGHLDQTRANAQSSKRTYASAAAANITKAVPEALLPSVNDESQSDFHPPQDHTILLGAKTHFLFTTIHDARGQIYTDDQPGRFLVSSSKGNSYMLVLYDYDSNYIHVEPMPSRSKESILVAYKKARAILIKAGLRSKLQRLDNEASAILQEYMTEQEIDFQLVPPHIHHQNAAERAICTFKNHFIAGLCSADENVPLHLWDRLLPQAMISLNLLRGSCLNPKLSAYAQVHGAFDFNRTPLAPPGTKVLIHEKPDVLASWAAYAVDGWYVGPALLHY